ncbi:hypothetical protein J6337_28745 [Burkholderia pseudomallei]|uniref:hypothetical protein n=1 Tax=Burkholderia pseudomallei TaxID=28450 RepID=UPI001AD6156A|nr:hypothetical protein [Burkholderia pseudomallei]MBO7866983.1 hypothetical protein [Burkholderia pseudomallei]MBO7873553.1 hypothetical protein [Burkholderia pseudomallei]
MLERLVSWVLARKIVPLESQKEVWIDRCAKRYEERGAVDSNTARDFAQACWENRLNDDESPEDAADEDMSYWENDGV